MNRNKGREVLSLTTIDGIKEDNVNDWINIVSNLLQERKERKKEEEEDDYLIDLARKKGNQLLSEVRHKKTKERKNNTSIR